MLLHLAYHLLGSMSLAEDIVQEISLQWLRLDSQQIDSPKAYLSRMTVNRALDQLRRAKREREEYPGPWLPEPVLEPTWEPDLDTLSLAVLHLMERLDPYERLVYMLRECFDWEYEAIASLIDKRSANCRQILSRAKSKLQLGKARYQVDAQALQQLSLAFLAASQNADYGPLRQLFSQEIQLLSDGGGKVVAARKPILGVNNCLKFLQGIQKQLTTENQMELRFLHGDWSICLWEGEQLASIMVASWQEGQIYRLLSYRNPDKLSLIQTQLRA
ncbi:MAG: sigma-70 family RNA polymerase sigma factor [Bacteroidota bacterium]